MRAVLAHRDARLSIAGQVLSGLGDNALWIAMAVWIKTITGSSSLAGLSFFMFTAGTLVSPLGGVVLDRCRRRPMLIGLNVAGAALISPLLLVHGRDGVPVMYGVMFGYGVLGGLVGGAQSALTQAVLPPDLLGGANGLIQTLNQGMRLLSPLLGAGTFSAFGAGPVIGADMVTFVICAALVALVSVPEEPPARSGEPMTRQLTAGLRHIMGEPVLRRLTGATALAIVAFGLSETVDFQVVGEGLHRSPAFFGVLNCVSAAGGVLSGLVSAGLLSRLGGGRLVGVGLTSAAAGFALLTAPVTAVVLAGGVLVGCGIPPIVVALLTALQQRTPAGLMGRVNTAADIVISAPQTVAIAAGAWLVGVVDFRVLLAAMAATLLAAALLARRGTRDEPAAPATTATAPVLLPTTTTTAPAPALVPAPAAPTPLTAPVAPAAGAVVAEADGTSEVT